MTTMTFTRDADGRWWLETHARQCPTPLAGMSQRCQGAQGHPGPCWCYLPDGTLVRGDEFAPPGHDRHLPPAFLYGDAYFNARRGRDPVDDAVAALLDDGDHAALRRWFGGASPQPDDLAIAVRRDLPRDDGWIEE